MTKRTIEITDQYYKVIGKVVIPKQFLYWLKKAGLKAECRSRKYGGDKNNSLYWIGHGRHWRLNCMGIFECSDKFANFDRWANSNPGVGHPIVEMDSEESTLRVIRKIIDDASHAKE